MLTQFGLGHCCIYDYVFHDMGRRREDQSIVRYVVIDDDLAGLCKHLAVPFFVCE